MACRKVFDDSNPFAPELKRPKIKPSTSEVCRNVKAPIQRMKMRVQGMDAYQRHKLYINNYVLFHKGSTSKMQRDTSNDRNDLDIIRENHRFLWDSDPEQTDDAVKNWESNLAKKYYDKLFKEYCIADLSQYKQNRVAMRWRVEQEVFSGKGQFECGSKHCKKHEDLTTWEVNFAYIEHGERKNALVKLRLCPDCSKKLNFHSQKRQIKRKVKELKEEESSIAAEEKKRKRARKHRHRRNLRRSRSSSGVLSSDGGEEGDNDDVSGSGQDTVSGEQKRKEQESNQKKAVQEASEIWTRKTAVVEAEKTVEDEFDEFFDDLFL